MSLFLRIFLPFVPISDISGLALGRYSNEFNNFLVCHHKLSFHITIMFFFKTLTMFCKCVILPLSWGLYAVEAQTSLALLSRFHGSRITTAHAHQCCIFQSYAKTVPSRMKLTMREPASMATDT